MTRYLSSFLLSLFVFNSSLGQEPRAIKPRHEIRNSLAAIVKEKPEYSSKSDWAIYSDVAMGNIIGRIKTGDSVLIIGWASWLYFVKANSTSGYISWKALVVNKELDSLSNVIQEQSPIEVQEDKLNDERLAKEEAEKIGKQKLVNKYGEYWGNLVYSSEYTLGMSKSMVLDILEQKRTTYFLNGMLNPANVTYKDCYTATNSGKSETLTFSKNKFFAFMEKVVGKTTNQTEQIMLRESINMIKQPLLGQDMLKSNFPTFIFTDGKLTEMYY